MQFLIYRLRWRDLDPASHPFDVASVRPLIEPLVRSWAAQPRVVTDLLREDPRQIGCARAIDIALLVRYGAWIAGWDWASGEEGGGGPVSAWSGARDSVLRADEPTDATVERVIAAVTDWRDFLLEQAALHETLRHAELAPEDALERAAVSYVERAVTHTGADDAWYGTFELMFGWHLEACGLEDEYTAAQIVSAAVYGQFASWVVPAASAVASVAETVALDLAALGRRITAPRDGLAQWLEVRACEPRGRRRTNDPGPVLVDGHRAFIEMYDRARSLPRAARMHAALDLVRAAAHAGSPLDWPLLCDAQRLVLGADADVKFRSGDAFARMGHVRYRLSHDTAARFAIALSEANDPATTPVLRAARAYLDVCFFHPFADGNARAARLALDYVLTRAGLALHTAAPAFLLPRAADDDNGLWSLFYLLDHLAGASTPGG